jgi:hypothetical protein
MLLSYLVMLQYGTRSGKFMGGGGATFRTPPIFIHGNNRYIRIYLTHLHIFLCSFAAFLIQQKRGADKRNGCWRDVGYLCWTSTFTYISDSLEKERQNVATVLHEGWKHVENAGGGGETDHVVFKCLSWSMSGQERFGVRVLHCQKSLAIFPSPAGMSLTKLSLAGNNLIIPGHDSWDGKIPNHCYSTLYRQDLYFSFDCPPLRSFLYSAQKWSAYW